MINRRRFLQTTGSMFLGSSLLSLNSCFSVVSKKKLHEKPNVIFFLTDDLGYNDIGCYGNERIKTPNIDSLAKQGILFTDAHTPASICTPTRYGLLTGRYCWRTWLKKGVIGNNPLMVEPGRYTLPRLFKDQGYSTSCIGKWHLGTRMTPPNSFDGETHFRPPIYPGPNEIGFDYSFILPVGHFYPPYIYLQNHSIYKYDPDDPVRLVKSEKAGIRGYLQNGGTDARYDDHNVTTDITNQAVKFIDKQGKKPFFMYFATSSPHDPYTPAKRFRGKSKLGIYGDFIAEIDWSLGQIVKQLKEQNIYDNTIIIFSSDNGGENREREVFKRYNHNPNGLWRGHKGQIYEGSNRVPFIIRWPNNCSGGQKSDNLIMLNDMLAAFAAFFGKELPEGEGPDSQNMLNTLKGMADTIPRKNSIFHSRAGMFAIRDGCWKYIHGRGDGDWKQGNYPTPDQKGDGQLYNLKIDPMESNNLYSEHPDMVSKLQSLLIKCYNSGKSS